MPPPSPGSQTLNGALQPVPLNTEQQQWQHWKGECVQNANHQASLQTSGIDFQECGPRVWILTSSPGGSDAQWRPGRWHKAPGSDRTERCWPCLSCALQLTPFQTHNHTGQGTSVGKAAECNFGKVTWVILLSSAAKQEELFSHPNTS